MYNFIVFDLDGTLLDTLDDITAAVNVALATIGQGPLTREAVRPMLGYGTDVLIESAIERHPFTPATFQAVKDAYMAYYNAHQIDHTHPYPGMPELLRSLKSRGYTLFVFSNKPDALAHSIVTHFFGEGVFAGILGQKKGAQPKPDPSGLLTMLGDAHVDLAETLFIGDSQVDIQTAVNAHLPSVGVTWGFRTRNDLRQVGPTYMVDTPHEILSWLARD